MAAYWARFAAHKSHIFRFDTRIYLHDAAMCRKSDTLVGAVVAKNPGSARPSEELSNTLQSIDLANDKLLPTVRSLVTKAYARAKTDPPARSYVQVLNLFYLCDKQFGHAIRTIEQMVCPPVDAAESKKFPWIMYLWGEFEVRKTSYIQRFADLDSENHFYFDKNRNELVCDIPGEGSFAKHTQGLKLEPVIAHIASLL